jgi:putative transcriptional regulator
MKNELENSIHKLRVNAKVTQQELAKSVGVTRQTIITLEKGECVPSVTLAIKIAKFFNKSVEEVFKLP